MTHPVFRAALRSAKLKAATTKYDRDGEQIDTPAVLTIAIEVEAPSPDVMALVAQLASDGRDVEVELSSFQLGFGE